MATCCRQIYNLWTSLPPPYASKTNINGVFITELHVTKYTCYKTILSNTWEGTFTQNECQHENFSHSLQTHCIIVLPAWYTKSEWHVQFFSSSSHHYKDRETLWQYSEYTIPHPPPLPLPPSQLCPFPPPPPLLHLLPLWWSTIQWIYLWNFHHILGKQVPLRHVFHDLIYTLRRGKNLHPSNYRVPITSIGYRWDKQQLFSVTMVVIGTFWQCTVIFYSGVV